MVWIPPSKILQYNDYKENVAKDKKLIKKCFASKFYLVSKIRYLKCIFTL